jgi:hypothetical protein
MEVICSSETSVDFQRTTQRCIPEDGTIWNHRCENLKHYTWELLIYCEYLMNVYSCCLVFYNLHSWRRIVIALWIKRLLGNETPVTIVCFCTVTASYDYNQTIVGAYEGILCKTGICNIISVEVFQPHLEADSNSFQWSRNFTADMGAK